MRVGIKPKDSLAGLCWPVLDIVEIEPTDSLAGLWWLVLDIVEIEPTDSRAGLRWLGLDIVENGRVSKDSIVDSLWGLASSIGEVRSGTGSAGSSVIILASSSPGKKSSGTRGSLSAERELDRLVSLEPKSRGCIMGLGSEPGDVERGDGSSGTIIGTVLGDRFMAMGPETCLLSQVSNRDL